jgi:hypothetical protein
MSRPTATNWSSKRPSISDVRIAGNREWGTGEVNRE